MKVFSIIQTHNIIRLITAAICLMTFCGIGRCEEKYSPYIFNSDNDSLSYQDSLIQEMVEFIKPGIKLSKNDRKNIEQRIKHFPNKVVRRDTVVFFINSAYAVAYYEFYKHDYKKAKKFVDNFNKKGMPPGIFPSFFNYSTLGMFASLSLHDKGKFKSKKYKNSWFSFHYIDSIKTDFRRTTSQFIDTYFDEIPMSLSISTYKKILTFYKKEDGRLERLNGYSQKGFLQRCVDSGRKDILRIVFDLWNIKMTDLHIGKSGYIEYNQNKISKTDSIKLVRINEEILLFDPVRLQNKIDSILYKNDITTISNLVLRLLSNYLGSSGYKNIIKVCEKYHPYLYSKELNTLHDYWGLALSYLGKYDEAIIHFDYALNNTTDPKVLSTIRLNKACSLGEMGYTDEAISIFIDEKKNQSTPFERFVWNDNLGYIYSFKDSKTALFYYNEAEKHLDSGISYPERKIRHYCRKARVLESNKYLQRLAIEEALKHTRNKFCADVAKGVALTELGVFNASTFNYEEADNNFSTAYKCFSKLDEDDIRFFYLNLNYSLNLCNLGRYDEAAHILITQLENNENIYGKNHIKYYETLSQLLILLCQHEVIGLSVDKFYQDNLELRKNIDGLRDYDTLKVDLAYSLYRKDWNAAKGYFERALDMPMTSMQKLEYCMAYESASGEYCNRSEYNKIFVKLLPIIKTTIINGLLLLTGNEKRAMQDPLSKIIDGAIKAGSYENALQLSLFRKGLLFVTRQAVEKKLARGRKTRQEYRNLLEKKKELNAVIEYNDTLRIPELIASISNLEMNLNQTIDTNNDFYQEIDQTISKLTSVLKPNDVAVDFIKFRDNGELKYGAFLINSEGFLKFIRLGGEDELKANPAKIWELILTYSYEYNNIYFSTDGFLNNMGIEFMKSGDGRPMSICYKMHRVFHLSEIKPDIHLGENIVAIGVSDHNSPIGEAETINRGSWTDLPGVKDEILMISKNLSIFNPRLIMNDEASENTVKQLSGTNTTALHFSTHGFFRSSKMLQKAAADSENDDYNVARRFLSSGVSSVSGLVMRQGNNSWKCKEILDDFDDLLTAEEIEMMSFPDLRLTVLSACDSGLGEVDSEGVWGLQRAFRIAGTKSLICSLTKVDDYWTAQFMDAFYEHAAKGNTIYDSFHIAQKWLYNELPDNPEIWSSFILIE